MANGFRINKEDNKYIDVTKNKRFIIMSDMHRGDGSCTDDFAHNSLIFKCALEYYFNEDFTLIELGDAEELWENKKFDQIYITHSSIYEWLMKFHAHKQGRYIKIWGNHDLFWKDKRDDSLLQDIFPSIRMYESAVINAEHPIMLIHGHQFDASCSGRAILSKAVVRHVWPFLQRCGFKDPTRAADNPGKCNCVDEDIHHWSKTNDEGIDVVIAGHTHRPVYENLSLTERRYNEQKIGAPGITRNKRPDSCYFNAGSCVHPRCITGIELTFDNGRPTLSLIKWAYEIQKISSLEQARKTNENDEFNLAVKRVRLEPSSLTMEQS